MITVELLLFRLKSRNNACHKYQNIDDSFVEIVYNNLSTIRILDYECILYDVRCLMFLSTFVLC